VQHPRAARAAEQPRTTDFAGSESTTLRCQPINMPGYAYERTCRRLAERINSNTPSTRRVTRNNVSLASGPEWSNETRRNGALLRVRAWNLSRNVICLRETALKHISALNPETHVASSAFTLRDRREARLSMSRDQFRDINLDARISF